MHSVRMSEVIVRMHVGLGQHRAGSRRNRTAAQRNLRSKRTLEIRIDHSQRHQLPIAPSGDRRRTAKSRQRPLRFERPGIAVAAGRRRSIRQRIRNHQVQ